MRERVDGVRAIKREPARFTDAGIVLRQEGRARFESSHTLVLESGRRVTASSILVCVGGHSRRLPIPGAELATVPEHVLDLPRLPRRVAIIGAGNTGMQLATVFDSLGSAVTLLDLAPRVLMASDAEISAVVTAAFTAQGIVGAHRHLRRRVARSRGGRPDRPDLDARRTRSASRSSTRS